MEDTLDTNASVVSTLKADDKQGQDEALPFILTEKGKGAGTCLKRNQSRAGLLSVRHRSKVGWQLLVEDSGNGGLELPNNCAISSDSKASYRAQLFRKIVNTYDEEGCANLGGTLHKASSHRCRARNKENVYTGTHFFSGASIDELKGESTTVSTVRYVPLNGKLTSQLTHPDDAAFVKEFLSELDTGYILSRARWWHTSFERTIQDALSHESSTASVLSNHVTSSDAILAPELNAPADIVEKPFGPALLAASEHSAEAMRRVRARLNNNPGATVAIDLEGQLGGANSHVSLLQLVVDPTDDTEEPLVYVFDTHTNSALLREAGDGSLRALLEDAAVLKVFHCCRGDLSALFHEYDIITRGVIDTSVADALLMCTNHNKTRGLAPVLKAWLGDEYRELTFKSAVAHEHGLWERRPLHYNLFVYAYEDVLQCNLLARVLRSLLRECGQWQLCLALSSGRGPPSVLHKQHPQYAPPTHVAIALQDHTRVVCLQNARTNICSMPIGALLPGELHGDLRCAARRVWTQVMGAPPPGASQAINSRLQKPIRLGDTLLFVGSVTDVAPSLPEISARTAQAQGSEVGDAVARYIPHAGIAGGGYSEEQEALFEYLQARNASITARRQGDASVSMVHSVGEELRVQASLCVDHNGQVRCPLFTSLRAAKEDVVMAASAATKTPPTVAIILHLGEDQVYTLTNSKGTDLAFPTHRVESDVTPKEAALKAFDLYAGVSLRKTGDARFQVMPRTSAALIPAFRDIQEVGVFNNTIYFSAAAPEIAPSAFFAARQLVNGFQLSKTQSNKHPDFKLCSVHTALKGLSPTDCNGLHASCEARSIELATVAATCERVERCGERPYGRRLPRVQRRWGGRRGSTRRTRARAECGGVFGRLGDDPEYDSLFMAAVAIRTYLLEEAATAAVTACPAQLPKDDEYASVGSSPRFAMPSAAEVSAEQQRHPGTAALFDYVNMGELSHSWLEATAADRKQLATNTVDLYISNGVLMKAGKSGEPGRVFLPPKYHPSVLLQYHDRCAHFGVNKTLELLSRRFYWGSTEVMRETVRAYIGGCEPCQRSKRAHAQKGSMQVLENGDHPNDIVGGDVYWVGKESDGYDTTLDFVDYFSRRVTATAMKGAPTSRQIMDVLIGTVIRHGGVPREIRSDLGANFISAAVKALYAHMGIKMVHGTAYQHQLVALVERWHQTLKQLLLCHWSAKGERAWHECLPLLELAYNSTVNRDTGYSPFFVERVILPLRSLYFTLHDFTDDPPCPRGHSYIPLRSIRLCQEHRDA